MRRGEDRNANESTRPFTRTASFDPESDEADADDARAKPTEMGGAKAKTADSHVRVKPADISTEDTEPSSTTRAGDTPDPAPSDDTPNHPAQHRRRSSFAVPVLVFVVLLIAAGVVGRFIVPAGGPEMGSQPPSAALSPSASTVPTPALSPLPTPPARPADLLALWAGRVGSAVDIPVTAIQAYGYAQLMLRQTDPTCNLSWTTLAGISAAESNHGQANGAVLDSTGRSTPLIVGPILNGQGGQPLVEDTDAGAFDGDTKFDRAMGPLRLTPQRWRTYAIDADNDGIIDPYDLDDSALALARILCSGNEDLSTRDGWNAAVARYRSGTAYAASVFTTADNYGQRTRDIT